MDLNKVEQAVETVKEDLRKNGHIPIQEKDVLAVEILLDLAQSVLSCRSVLGEPIGKADEFIPDDKEEAYRLGSKDAKDEDAVIVVKIMNDLKELANGYRCDNVNCGNGAICNLCHLKGSLFAYVDHITGGSK